MIGVPRQTPFTLSGLVEMARQLEVRVLAEGVESEAELLVLRASGITLFQGYYFANPALMELPPVPFLDASGLTASRQQASAMRARSSSSRSFASSC